MAVEIINDKMPLVNFGMRLDRGAHMIEQVRFIAGRPMRNGANFARSHHEIDHEGLRAMALVFKRLILDSACFHGQGLMFAFQRLHPGQLVGADNRFALPGQLRRLLIQLIDVAHFFIQLFINDWCQPIANQVWLQSPFFSSRAACRGEI